MKNFDIKTASGIILLFVIITVIWGIAGNLIFDRKARVAGKPIFFKRVYTNLLVKDVDKSIAFYNDFGFNATTVYPDTGECEFAIIKKDSVEIMLQSKASFDKELDIFSKEKIGGTFSLYFDVTNVDSIYSSLNDTISVIKDLNETFYGTKEFAITDSDGYLLIFAEEK